MNCQHLRVGAIAAFMWMQQEAQAQDLSGLTSPSYGNVEWHPASKTFMMNGSCSWGVWGKVLDNGQVLVLWTSKSDGRICPGLYTWQGGTRRLVGVWGWPDSAWISPGYGDMMGKTYNDSFLLTPLPKAAGD